MKQTKEDLQQLQKVPLKYKEMLSFDRIRELMRYAGHDSDNIYISFSGGKDSEVLVDLMAKSLSALDYDHINVLYINTGLEYSSVRDFIKPFLKGVSERHHIDIRLDVRTPKKSFKQVIRQYGYPVISKEVAQNIEEARKGISKADGSYQRAIAKLSGTLTDKNGGKSRYCCDKYSFLVEAPFRISKHCCPITKQEPARVYEKETGRIPVIGTLAEESALRTTKWQIFGCNAFSCERPQSAPLSFWTENDILAYLKKYGLPIAEPYGSIVEKDVFGQERLFGLDFKEPDEKKWELTGCSRTGCVYCLFGISYDSERFLRMQKLEPKKADFVLRGGKFDETGMWVPNDEGLGFWFICDYLTDHGIPVPYIDKGYRQYWAADAAA